MNVGKWVLRNLFIDFIREEQQRHSQDGAQPSLSRAPSNDVLHPNTPNRSLEPLKMLTTNAVSSGAVVSSSNMIPAVMPTVSPTARSSPLLTPLIPLNHSWRDTLSGVPSMPQSPMPLQDTMPTPIHVLNQRNRSGTTDSAVTSSLPSLNPSKDDCFTRTRQQSLQGNSRSPDDFSGWSSPGKQEPQSSSGIMGRLKNFGKIAKRPPSEVASISTPESAAVETPVPTSVSLI